MHNESPPSIWRLSELLTWLDFGFIPDTDDSDVEAYCSFIGAYDVCSMFQNVIPLVHGPIGCVSSYYATRIASRLNQKVRPLPLGTCMDKNDAVFGSMDRLIAAIESVDQLYHPRLIVVLTTCVPDMIGENVASLPARLSGRVQADILPLPVGGISCKGFREGSNLAFRALVDYANRKTSKRKAVANSVNLFLRRVHGKLSDSADIAELTRLLNVNGIAINTVVRSGASYDDLMKLPLAGANLSMCSTYGIAVMKHLQDCFDQGFQIGTYPIGLEGTLDWVRSATNLLSLPDRLSESGEVGELRSRCTELRTFLDEHLKAKEMYIWQPGEKGLAFIKLAHELGLQPIFIGFTYYMMKTTRETIISLLNQGHDPKVIIRGHSKLWLDYQQLPSQERPLLVMPKKFWLGELPCLDIDLFRDPVVGLSGLRNIITRIFRCYQTPSGGSRSLFDRYVEERYDSYIPVSSEQS